MELFSLFRVRFVVEEYLFGKKFFLGLVYFWRYKFLGLFLLGVEVFVRLVVDSWRFFIWVF